MAAVGVAPPCLPFCPISWVPRTTHCCLSGSCSLEHGYSRGSAKLLHVTRFADIEVHCGHQQEIGGLCLCTGDFDVGWGQMLSNFRPLLPAS